MDSLYRSAMQLTKNSSDAEDLVQETYIKAYRFWDKFQPGSNCKAWLFRIMTNAFINEYRAKSRSPVAASVDTIDDRFLYSQQVASSQLSNPEHMLYSRLLRDEVTRAIESLPDEFRLVVILAFVEKFSYRQIADITGLHLGTVKSRIHRGRKLCQKLLADYAVANGFASAVAS
ncbi:MAG: sigma-70 family RNA polymerase sigma factor [Candidatus Zixiibacteriota bacterium]|nr:MAG: sigma-70 family RNA polymerase sigma factor [candidate division Zixibacteria bacterium]